LRRNKTKVHRADATRKRLGVNMPGSGRNKAKVHRADATFAA